MKKTGTLIIFFAAMFIACNNDNNKINSTGTASSEEKKISKRDYSITKQNAYNDLFLDTADVENFISKNNIADSIAARIRSFYNTPNYQFAWLSSTGLTEQAFGFWSLKNYEADTSGKIKSLQRIMNDLMADDSPSINNRDKSIINTELLLTENFITYTRSNFEKNI